MSRTIGWVDPFIVLMLGLVVLASIAPVRGLAAQAVEIAAEVSIVLLFFLHGAKLSREAIVSGFSNLRLHAAVLATTFALFPLLGLAIRAALTGHMAPGVLDGILFLCLLPSTVQSSIAFTAIARGNVAAAVCSASFSSLLGVMATPFLVALLMGHSASVSTTAIEKIVLQLVLPFAAGHLLRPWMGKVIDRHRKLVGRVDRSSILLIVFSAFSASVVEGLWNRVDAADIAAILLVSAAMLATVMALTWWASARIGLAREDRIVMLFAGSKKSLATGVPIASTLFPPAALGPVLLPVMLFHQLQLIVCAAMAQAFARGADDAAAANPATA
ncbi:bile acid:sodium symporter family protein [Sphingomonas sp. BK235]|uniref:bile acid:sodium symporter family protein n=1 Tax=Sphingomonas sp. BK235 TaxID=2512131 RepID=UPI0010F0733A|nr:bile acid:sodium symporter family protein [Sphingomonas sp. BK235]TCP29884.1 sodium/bile acid cotransporter 7 [Sphingomonas sp. BK235]